MIEYYQRLIYQYPIISIEDPLDENDTHGWREMIAVLGDKINIIGDDIFVTNVELLKQNIHLANGIIIKPNQIGTLTETVNTIKYAQNNNYTIIVSHRSGETEDTTIAHLATAIASDYIKAGSLCRSERVSKYNELIRINKNFY
jgi:enolase